MKRAFSRVAALLLTLCLIISILPGQTARATEAQARDITEEATLTVTDGVYAPEILWDNNPDNAVTVDEGCALTLEHPEGFGSLYFIFHMEYNGYTVTNNDTGAVHILGEKQFLHEFVDLTAVFGDAPKSITISFPNGNAQLREIYAYTTGAVPAFVQQWKEPADNKADLVLFSTHGDDEQLFFAGLLPYYAGELGYQVQVCYLTSHRKDNPDRMHEMLNGLWTVGVTTYPVFGEFDDFRLDSLGQTYSGFAARGWSREELLSYVVEQIRRFKPLVAVGHDVYGEYGHGQHRVYTDLLMDALEISNDPSQYPELAEKYGLWDVPKTYLHLYWENKIVMDWDKPLEKFDGMTAFEVTKFLGFPCHKSQQQDFAYFLWGATKATETSGCSPAYYGLYRTTVGLDVEKNDFFENLTTYGEIAEDIRLAEEAALKALEEERQWIEAKEQARLEAQRRAEEEAARQEAERLAAEEAAQLAAQEAQRQQKLRTIYIAAGGGASVVLLAVLLFLWLKKKKTCAETDTPKNI